MCRYRGLNAKVVKVKYPRLVIEDHLNCSRRAKIFTTLDLKNSFFHLSIEDADCKYTDFVVPGGHYEFLRLPFSLCISPAYFQKYINAVFRKLVAKGIIIIYMDDLIVPSENLNEGKERLEWVLKRASEYRLQINCKKCQILQSCVNYLRYIVGRGKTRPSSEKTSAVRDFPEPKNVKPVQGFLGLTGFFRKFIHDYARVARPLTELTKKDVNLKFENEERCAFNEFKNALCEEPVLALKCHFAETELHTDASSLGLRAILLQCDSEDRQMNRFTMPAGRRRDKRSIMTATNLKSWL